MKKLIGLSFVVFTTIAANAETRYQFWTISVPGSAPHATLPLGINNQDVIAGYYLDNKAFVWHGFTYDANKKVWVYPIDYPDANGTFATSINDSGELAGYFAGLSSTTEGMLDFGGAFSFELVPCPFFVSIQTNGVNNAGYTAGGCQQDALVGSGSLSWVWAQGNAVIFGCPTNGVSSTANAINNKGQVVGWYAVGSVVGGYLANYNGSCVTEVHFPGTAYTNLTGINDDGWAIGTGSSPNSPDVGFFYNTSSGQFTAITPPSGAVNGVAAMGLNNSGSWVGWYFDENNNAVAFYATPPLVFHP